MALLTARVFQSWQAVNTYIDALARYGIDSAGNSADLSGRVCNITCVAWDKGELSGELELAIQRSAALVALCMLGPDAFSQFAPGRHAVSTKTIVEAVRCFRQGGVQAAAHDLQVFYAVAAAGRMHSRFVAQFFREAAYEK